jgi:hypothetical protein
MANEDKKHFLKRMDQKFQRRNNKLKIGEAGFKLSKRIAEK